MKIGDKIYMREKIYNIWLGINPSAPYYDMLKEIDYDNPGIIKGFQSPKYDGRDTIVRWKDFLWDTTIPSQFLIKKEK